MTAVLRTSNQDTARIGTLAGTAGGLAEIAWVWAYGALTGADPALVARGVSVAVGAGAAPAPLALGIAIHMVLAIALGVALAFALRPAFARMTGAVGRYAVVVSVLALVWAVNFLIVLPLLSQAFVDLMPYAATLISKLLFGISAASVLAGCRYAIRVADPEA